VRIGDYGNLALMIIVCRSFVRRATLALRLAGCAAAALALTAGHSSGEGFTVDDGKFIVSQHGKAARLEEFSMDQNGDTLVVRAQSRVTAGTKSGRPPDKIMALEVGALDFTLVRYASDQILGPDTLRRGIETTPGDTVFSIYRELNEHGVGDMVAMPPGRLYILDPPLFTTFNLIGRTLQGKVFDRRPIGMLILGTPDTIVEVMVTDLGNASLRWGGRAVRTRKLLIADQRTRFTAWISPDGRMLRLAEPAAGLVVERQAPPAPRAASPVKRRAPAKPQAPRPK
jgi:hypothetical protein